MASPVPAARWKPLLLLVLLGVALRVVLWVGNVERHWELYLPDSRALVAASRDPAGPFVHPIGYEYGNMARAWLDGHPMSSPFGGSTGPSAWSAPVPVLVYVAAFGLGGPYSGASVVLLDALTIAISVLLILLADVLGRWVGRRRRSGLLAAGLVAVAPYDAWLLQGGERFDLNLVTLALVGTTAAAMWWSSRPSTARATLLGLVAGAAGLTCPVALAPAAVILALVVLERGSRRAMATAMVCCAVAGAMLAPYVVWQSKRTGILCLVKSNSPFEVRLGNAPEAGGVLTAEAFSVYHPIQDEAAFERYRRLGEGGFLRMSLERFRDGFQASIFARNTLQRLAHLFFLHQEKPWDGSWVRTAAKRLCWALPGMLLVVFLLAGGARTTPGLILVTAVLAYAAPYAVVAVMDRYKVPMMPLLLVMGAVVAESWWEKTRWRPGFSRAAPVDGRVDGDER